jgi:hypothetical protein
MARGPKNALVREELERQAQQRLEAMRLPPMPPIREWRFPPDGREYSRRYQVWELLAWYHHEVVLPERGLRAWMLRKWRQLFGGQVGRTRNLSPWQQLALRDRWEAEDWAVRQNALAADEERKANLEVVD